MRRIHLLLLGLTVLAWTNEGVGQTAAPQRTAALGAMTARDEQGRPVEELALQSHHVQVEILDGIAKTTVEENFRNHTDRRLEGVFRFPLPADASISRLALEVNGKIEEGTCLERERAREVFQSIVNKAKDPALLEWMPGGIFQCRVFPIEPRATKRVIIGYTQSLPYFRGRITYTYPLASETTRVHPPEELRIEVRVRCSGELRRIECPSFPANIQRREPGEATVVHAASHASPKEDFVVSLEAGEDELRVVPHKPEGEEGYFALFLTPRGGAARVAAKYLLMLEVCASVSPRELDLEKKLVRAMIANGIPGDRFEILSVNLKTVSSGEVDARGADDFLDRLQPIGGLDLGRAIRSAPEGRIVYIGRAIPSFGELDPAKILESARGRQIRSVSISSRANVDLLQRMGSHRRIVPGDDAPARVAEVAATLGSPAIEDLAIEGGPSISDVAGLRDIFYGERLVVTGRYHGRTANLVISGKDFRRELQVAFPPVEEGNNYVRRLWAQRRLADLLVTGPLAKSQITELGVRYQIMTPYTSFLVLENEQMWKDYQLQRTVQAQDRVLGAAPSTDWVDPQPGIQMGTRFLPPASGSLQVIDLPRMQSSEPTLALERRATTNQFGGLEFALGESARTPVIVSGSTGGTATVLRHLPENLPLRSVYTAKIEEGKTIHGQPLRAPFNLGTFWFYRDLESMLTRDPSGRPLGTMNFDPQTNCFVVRDSKAVLDRIAARIREEDVEPRQLLLRDRETTWVVAVSRPPEDSTRRTRQTVSLSYRNAPLSQIVEEFRRQTGWTVLLPASTGPSDDRIDEFMVDGDWARAALNALASKAGMRVSEEPEGVMVLNRPRRISLNARNEDVRTVLQRVAREADIEIDLSPEVKADLTLTVGPIAWDELIGTIAKTAGAVAVRRSPTRIEVLPSTTFLKEMDVRVFRLTYLGPSDDPNPELTGVLEALLTRDQEGRIVGRIAGGEGSRIYVILDNDGVRLRAQEILAYLDVEPGSVVNPFELKQTYPPGIPELLGETRARMALPRTLPTRETEIRMALRRLQAALIRFYGGGPVQTEMTGSFEMAAGSESGIGPGQFFAVTRGKEFRAIVRVVESVRDRAQVAVWQDLAVGRIQEGDRAERLRAVEPYLERLPEEIRKNLDSRRSAEEIRSKMGSKE